MRLSSIHCLLEALRRSLSLAAIAGVLGGLQGCQVKMLRNVDYSALSAGTSTGVFSLAQSTLTVSAPTTPLGNAVTVTLTARDSGGTLLNTGGLAVAFSNIGGTSTGTFSAVTDHGDGTYTATFTGATVGSATTIRGTIDASLLASAFPTVTVTPGAASLSQSTVTVGAATVLAGANTTVTLTVRDSAGNQHTSGGLTVAFSHTGGTSTGTFSAVTDHGDGTYTATFTGVLPGTGTSISATIGGSAITSVLPTIQVDGTTISSVTFPVKNYSTFNYMNLTVNFNNTVTVDTTGGTPSITVTINGNARSAAYLSGSGSSTLIFRYVVVEGESATAGQVSTSASVALNSGTIKDGGNNTPALTFSAPNTAATTVEYRYPEGSAGNSRKVHKIAATRDGTGDIYLCGKFTSYRNIAGTNTTAYGRVMRMNEDLSPDTTNTTFNSGSGTGFNGDVWDCEVAKDGTDDLIVVGDFTSFNGTATPRIARVSASGVLNTTFTTNLGTGPQELSSGGNGFAGRTYTVLPLADGTIYAGGTFQRFNGNTIFSRLIKLNADGTVNAFFQNYVTTAGESISPGNNAFVVYGLNQVPVDANTDGIDDGTGNILVTGGFFSYALQNHGNFSGTGLAGLLLIQTDGTFVGAPTWNTGSGALVHSVAYTTALPNGKFLVGGFDQFNDFNGTTVKSAVRINADGTLDATFNTGTGPIGTSSSVLTVRRMLPLSDGRIVMVGQFSTYNGTANRNSIALLTSGGVLDADHTALLGTGFAAGEVGAALALVGSGGKTFVVGGEFTQINGTSNRRNLWKFTAP